MVAEKSVSVDVIELTLRGMREAPLKSIRHLSRVKAQQLVEPVFNRVILAISDRLFKTDLGE